MNGTDVQLNAEKAAVILKGEEKRTSYTISFMQGTSVDGHTKSRITYTPGDSATKDMRAAVIVME